jgi:hypothetical protein
VIPAALPAPRPDAEQADRGVGQEIFADFH